MIDVFKTQCYYKVLNSWETQFYFQYNGEGNFFCINHVFCHRDGVKICFLYTERQTLAFYLSCPKRISVLTCFAHIFQYFYRNVFLHLHRSLKKVHALRVQVWPLLKLFSCVVRYGYRIPDLRSKYKLLYWGLELSVRSYSYKREAHHIFLQESRAKFLNRIICCTRL